MPAPEMTGLYQKALLWEMTGYDSNGIPTRASTSVEVPCRWVNKQSRMLNPQGQQVAIDAQVKVAIDIELGAVMWEGGLEDLAEELTGTGTATYSDVPTSNLMQVIAFSKVPDAKNRYQKRTVGLKYIADTMPNV